MDLVRLLSERKQNVLIWSAYYRNKSKTIWFGPKIISSIQYQRVTIWFCPSIRLAVEIDTPCSFILLAVEIDTPCLSILLALEIYTPCSSILLAVNWYTLLVHSSGGGHGYTLLIHSSAGGNGYSLHVHSSAGGKGCVLKSKRKHKCFDIKAFYWNKTKTFWFDPLIIGTKAERFDQFQNGLKSNRNVLAIFKILKTKPEQNQDNLLLFQNVFIYLGFIENKMELLQTISNLFLPVWNVFVCSKPLRNKTKLLYFLTNDIKTKTKLFQLCQGFLKTKQNFWLSQKNVGIGPEQKLLDQNCLVLIKNVSFRSRILF